MKVQALFLCAIPAITSLLSVAEAKADIIVSAGYYDLSPCCGNPNPVPNPWYGSPNTAFFGSSAEATSGDPDEAAILIQNTGSSAVTLWPGATVGPYTLWDSFIGAGYSIGAGDSVILSGTVTNSFDGSDIGLGGSKVSLTFNGTIYSFTDTENVLGGYPAYDETLPWTKLGSVTFSTVPEPSTWAMLIVGLAGLGFAGHRRSKRSATALAAA
jgi:hypothetical protein